MPKESIDPAVDHGTRTATVTLAPRPSTPLPDSPRTRSDPALNLRVCVTDPVVDIGAVMRIDYPLELAGSALEGRTFVVIGDRSVIDLVEDGITAAVRALRLIRPHGPVPEANAVVHGFATWQDYQRSLPSIELNDAVFVIGEAVLLQDWQAIVEAVVAPGCPVVVDTARRDFAEILKCYPRCQCAPIASINELGFRVSLVTARVGT